MKGYETEDEYRSLFNRILEFRPFRLQLITLASRVLLADYFLDCSPNWIQEYAKLDSPSVSDSK